MSELVIEITLDADGGYCAECLTESIFTEAANWDELRGNIREAVNAYFFDGIKPDVVRMHLVRDETLTLA